MLKTQFGLGVLSIPDILNTLSMVPGVICILIIASITTWSNYMIGVFKKRHREVYGIDDAGGLMFGRVGREFFSIGICICNSIPNSPNAEAVLLFLITSLCRLDLLLGVRHS